MKVFNLRFLFTLLLIFIFGVSTKTVSAQESVSVLYVPIIGITSVPVPLALPRGAGSVTYKYAVKNFLSEVSLSNIKVVDDNCSSVKFLTGDDNGDSKLDHRETWRFSCTTKLTKTTDSIATATGTANSLTATHNAYTTVVVGSNIPAPIVSIVNITKVAYPLSLPVEGGEITFTYRVNNPGVVPLDDVTVVDDKCKRMSGRLGDTNGNSLLDPHEVWIYTCTTDLEETTTNTVNVSAFANGLKAVDDATITVKIDEPASPVPVFPETGVIPDLKITLWGILSGILIVLILFFFLTRKRKTPTKIILSISILFLLLTLPSQASAVSSAPDQTFGWRFPVALFPAAGTISDLQAYSDIRDPGGIPQGLPVRLKIPIIGVDSAIEDAYIAPDGRMDVPDGSVNVAWFSLGPHPGRVGSAVIGGHFGITDGVPFVFYNLDKLKIGDKVYIEDDKGETLAFVVRKIKSFDRNADATTVFTSSDGLAHLNLITCEGVWNQVEDSYPDRLVVFTDSIPSEGPVVVKAEKAISVSEQTPAILPTPTSVEKIATSTSSLKSLYGSPVDGLVSSSLLVSIAFFVFKIIRPS